MFEKEYTSLREDFSAETLNWASEYVLGPEHSIRAIEIYCKILNKTRSTTYASKPFLDSRLVDQVILLSDLEQNLGVNDDDNAFRVDTSKSLATASSSPPPPPTVGRVLVPDPWSSLDESKRISKDTTETLICSILKLHLGIIRWLSLEDLIQTPYLFWISAR